MERLFYYLDKAIELIEPYDIIQSKWDTRDIRYIEAFGRYVRFRVNGESTELLSKSIREFEYLTKKYDFYRIHKSYIVNLKWVNKVTMINNKRRCLVKIEDKELPVSYRRIPDFQKCYNDYCRKRARFI